MRANYSKEEYFELIDYDYRFLPGDWWDFCLEFDVAGLECKHCGTTYKVHPKKVVCLECVAFGEDLTSDW